MYREKYLLFSNGGSSSDPLNTDQHEMAVYSVKDFKGMKPHIDGINTIGVDMFFTTSNGNEVVTLKVRNGLHSKVMQAISNAIVNSNQSIIAIADVDNNSFINSNIYAVTIKSQETFIQTLTDNNKTKLNVLRGNYKSCLITNTHSSAVTVTLKLVSQVGSDITDTTINAAEAEAVSTSSVTLNVDNTVPTNDLVLNEKIYKSDGTFFGVATSWTDATPDTIVFSGGIENAIADDDDLYAGTKYTLLNAVSIPANTVLKLESDEISFDESKYDLHAYSGNSSGYLTFTFNY